MVFLMDNAKNVLMIVNIVVNSLQNVHFVKKVIVWITQLEIVKKYRLIIVLL